MHYFRPRARARKRKKIQAKVTQAKVTLRGNVGFIAPRDCESLTQSVQPLWMWTFEGEGSGQWVQSQLLDELVVLLPSDLDLLSSATSAAAAMEQHSARKDDGLYLVLLKEVEAVQQEGKSAADFGARS